MQKNIFLWLFFILGLTICCPADDETPEWTTTAVRAPHVQHCVFTSAVARTKVSYHIYTPEIYDAQKEQRFPVLYWLHGTGGGLKGVAPVAACFDAAIRADKIPPLLIVFPNGMATSMWCDSKDGRVPMETMFVKDLIPYIDVHFRTIASRAGRIIEGFSMGGYGAARLGFKYPERFAAISFLGGGPLQPEFKVNETPRARPREAAALFKSVYDDDQEYFKAQSPWVLAAQNASALQSIMSIRQVIGDCDVTLENNRKLDAHLTQLKIPHIFTVLPGVAHNVDAVLRALGETNWKFYRDVFGKSAVAVGRK